MAFRLTRQESLSSGVPRVLHEELTAAINNLKTGTSGIHEARKSIKKLRGVLRMLEPRMGQCAREESGALGEASRSLAAARDNAAAIEIIDMLTGRHAGTPGTRNLTALRKRMLKRPVAATLELDSAISSLTQVKGRVAEWPAMPDNFTPVLEGLERTYRRGRRALQAVEMQPGPELFHSLRKRVKDHWYQVRLFEGIWAGEPREAQLRELQECLGDEQNLTVLEQQPLVPAVRKLVDKTRVDLRARALELAHIIYAEKPSDHAEKVLAAWSHWRESRKAPSTAQGRRYRQAVA